MIEAGYKWQPSDHTVSIELQPTVPEEKKETIIDLFINKMTVEGPLEKSQWVKTENYERYFPRAVPEGAKPRRAYATELLTAFAQKAYRRPLSQMMTRGRVLPRSPRRTIASPARLSNKVSRMPWRRCCPHRAFCSGSKCRPRTRRVRSWPMSTNIRWPRASPISSGRRCPTTSS